MDIKLLRKVHLYLGCFFAPLLVIFIITGALQTFELHEQKKNSSYVPPAVIKSLAEIHKHQRLIADDTRSDPSNPFRWFVLAMAAGLLLNITLGIVMALKFADPKVVVVVVVSGVLVPIIILSMPLWHKI